MTARAHARSAPLLAPWYRLVEDDDRLLLEHGQEVVVLEGAAVRAFLPALLPLLDGSRSLDEIVACIGEPARPAVVNALEILGHHGLLTEGPAPDEGTTGREAVYAFAASHDLPPADVQHRARTARLVIVGDAPVGTEVARLARRAGIASIARSPWAAAEGDLVVVAPQAAEVDLLASWNERALAASIAWLAVRPYDGRLAAVGPLVVPGESACHECVLLRRASNLDYRSDFRLIEGIASTAGADPGLESVVAGVATSIALRWLLIRDTRLPGRLHAIEAAPFPRIEVHDVLRVPRCSSCSDVERRAAPLPWHQARAA